MAFLNCQRQAAGYLLNLSFLSDDEYRTSTCRDADGPNSALQIESAIQTRRNDIIAVSMKPGGGFAGNFSKPPKYME